MTTPPPSVPPVPELAVTLAAVALHDAECSDRHCSGPALGAFYRQARIALEAAQHAIRADADSRRIPGSELCMAGVTAERERCLTMLRAAAARLAGTDAGASLAYADAADLIEGEPCTT